MLIEMRLGRIKSGMCYLFVQWKFTVDIPIGRLQ